jgi:hypothetical protein
MHFFTKYALNKFEILNKHSVFIRQEQIENCIENPEKEEKRGSYYFIKKESIGVVYKLEGNIKKIITFYPIKK